MMAKKRRTQFKEKSDAPVSARMRERAPGIPLRTYQPAASDPPAWKCEQACLWVQKSFHRCVKDFPAICKWGVSKLDEIPESWSFGVLPPFLPTFDWPKFLKGMRSSTAFKRVVVRPNPSVRPAISQPHLTC